MGYMIIYRALMLIQSGLQYQMPKLTSLNTKEDSFSFLRSTKKRFIDEFNRIKERYELNSMVLVLDLISAKFISSLFTVTELVGQGIVFVERLQKVRKTLDHHAIYFITPSSQSIGFMLQDFKEKDQIRYRKAHVLFSSSLDRNLMKKISSNQCFLKKLARHSFKEFYFEAFVISNNCVHFSIDYLSLAFSRDCNQQLEARARICRRFVDLLSSYDSLNLVRIYYQPSANQVAQRVALKAAKQIKTYLTQLLENKSSAIRQDASDVTIYITDRSIDIITPLIHGYAYESLLYDIADFSKESEIDKSKLKGAFFEQHRYNHLAHAISSLQQKLKEVVARITECQKLQAIQIKTLKEKKEELENHQIILSGLLQKFQQKGLGQMGEVELCLATGVTDEGLQTSSSKVFQTVIKIIKNSIKLCPNEIMRLALLTFICIKLSKADYQTLLGLFSQQQKTLFANLAVFGIRFDKKITKSTKSIDKPIRDRALAKLEAHTMASQRFTCALEMILPILIDRLKIPGGKADKLNMEQIVVSVTESQGVSPKFDEKKFICFMSGGLSQTQICCVRKMQKLSNVLLATDSILTPNQFLQQLSKIDLLEKNPNQQKKY